MMPQKARILVVEDQYFIAMEVERILNEATDCEVVLCRHDQHVSILEVERFDLVMLDAALTIEECEREASVVTAKGPQVAFLCAEELMAEEIERRLGFAVLDKPFDEAQIRSFVGKNTTGFMRNRP